MDTPLSDRDVLNLSEAKPAGSTAIYSNNIRVA